MTTTFRFCNCRKQLLLMLFALITCVFSFAQNPIVTENANPGNPSSEWDIVGAGDLSIQGFATDISVNKGQTVHFKINTDAAAYTITIYRLGYYNGNGARRIDTATITASLPQLQPDPIVDTATGLVDCGNWNESASWNVPSTVVSGIYLAKLTRTDNGGSSHIAFVVRDDNSHSNLFFQTSDATWQAYNIYGGNSLYAGTTSYPNGHATKVSYNRPFITRNGGGGGGVAQDWLFNAEYPMIRFLEKNGYDISYTTNVDVARSGSLILNHKIFLSVGHDEYWSAEQRSSVEAARNAGINLAFFSGNEVYWKTRWENSVDGTNTPYRTLVCYKEGTLGEAVCGGKCDPSPVWTGLWRDGCDFTGSGGCQPENALTGQISWQNISGAIQVPSDYKNYRFWRNTSVANLAANDVAVFTNGTLGHEWAFEQYPDSYPAGRVTMSSTTIGGKTHKLSLYRYTNGALIFGAGTIQWAWGLDENHDRGNLAPSRDMQQATINVLADMGVQPVTLQGDLTAAVQITDSQAPATVITSPVDGGSVIADSTYTISGTSSDTGGGVVAGVEISFDGGTTWHPATGTANWTYAWTPTDEDAGTATIEVRGFDDMGNLETPGTQGSANNITVNVAVFLPTPVSIFQPSDEPAAALQNDGQPIEVGVKFQTTINGYITGFKYYKGAGTTGVHIGHLWSRTGNMLAQATFTNESDEGWQQVILANPVAITAGTTYIVSYHSSSGDYAYTNPYFTDAVVNDPLRGLANGEDGPNGVYIYSSTSAFPVNNFNSSNYYVDVLFNTHIGPDITPPNIISISPADATAAVDINTTVTANFDEPINPATVSNATFQLHDASNALIPATVTYNSTANTIILTPLSPLLYSYTYTVTVKSGTSGIKDVAGNPLQIDYTWSFTTAAAPAVAPTEGHGGPILVISSSANPFSRYAVEILRAEGLNEFTAIDIANVNASILNNYDVVVLGETIVSAEQASMLSDWTNAGGTLIAFKPGTSLSSLFGITPAGSTLDNKYLLVNTASGPGVGIVNQTIQYHGSADLYTITGGSGATSLATLYSDATTATTNPAVTTRNVGANGGKAIAFTYDLAKSIIYTRQGNPAWAGEKRDGTDGPIRSDDMFFGLPAGSNNWVDFNKIAIPQADEQQRLLANIIIQSNTHRKPLPRFWYLPRSLKAAIVMTGDDHSNNGTQGRFEQYNHLSDSIGHNTPQDVANWYAIRGTSYLYANTPLDNSVAATLQGQGFEIALHPTTEPVCTDFTAASLEDVFAVQSAAFAGAFPSISAPVTNRTHCMPWSDWSTHAKIEFNHGIRFDVNYYYWPDTWIQNRPGVFTGSGMPMRFADIDGSLIDCYQSPTQMTDESGIDVGAFCDAVLDKAIGPEGYYGAFTANMHTDTAIHYGSNAIIASALARQIPIISAKQMLTWTDGRNNSFFGTMTWANNQLTFPITANSDALNLKAMLPHYSGADPLTSLTMNGSPISFTIETIKGIEYAFFDVPVGTNIYVANYSAAPAITRQPAAQTICSASTVTFKTDANGIPAPAVQWQSSTDGSNWNNIDGATDSTLVFTASMSDNNKQYRAVWSNLAGTINSTTATLIVKQKPTAPIASVADNCGNSVLTATGFTGSLLWSTAETTSSITVTTGDVYTVSQTINGCVSDSSIVTATPKIIPSAPTVTVADNCGNSLLTANNFTGSLLWSTGETTSSITVGTTGTYTVTQTVNGCASNNGGATATPKTIPSKPSVAVADNCGNSVLTASDFTGSLLWSTSETTSSITVTAEGNYSVAQTINGCVSENANVTAAPKVIPSAPSVAVADNCGNSVLTASGFTGSLLWNTSETTSSITVTTGGNYSVAQTINGCVSENGNVTAAPKVIPSAPSVTVTNNCGNSLLTAGNITGSLLWSTGETTSSITVSTAGTYTVAQTLNGCTSVDGSGTTEPKTVPSSPTVSVVDNCGNSVLTASNYTGTLLWDSGQTTSSITVTTGGTYNVAQTINGCASIPGTASAAPKIIPAAPTVSASSGCGTATLMASNITGSLLWSNGQTTPSITVSNPGTYVVNQTLNGCTSPYGSGTAVPTAVPSVPRITTVNNCGNSVLTASNYTGTLLWSTGETTPSITVTQPGTYIVTQTTNGCTSPYVQTRGGIAAPKVIPSAPSVVVADNCGNSVLTASNYTGTLLWSTGAATPSITVTTGATYTVAQTVNGCTSDAGSGLAAPKEIPQAPIINADGPTTFCEGESVTLTSNQATGNLWSTGATTPGTIVSASGTYTLTYTAANGCTAPDPATIEVTVKSPSSSTTNVTVCSASLPYSWNGNNYTDAGTYSIHGFTNAVGCDSTAILILTVNQTPDAPIVTALGPTTFCQGGSVILVSDHTTGNAWSTGETTQSIIVNQSGSYTVTYTGENGCTSANSQPTVVVTVNTPTISTTNLTICSNELPYSWNNNSYTEAGTYNVTLNNNTGCDSVAVLILNVKDTSVSTTNVTICSSLLPYSWNGNSYNAGGTYQVNGFTNAVGCDSSAVLILNVNPVTNSTTPVTICSTELPYSWNGTTYTQPGTYTINGFINAAGCDSSATLVLTVNQATTSTTNITVCSSALPYHWNDNDYTDAGTYSIHLLNAAGCDSLATLVLTVNTTPAVPTISASGATTFCAGGSVMLTSSEATGNLWSTGETTQSITVTTAGAYSVSVTSANGCVSDVSLPVTVIVNAPTSSVTDVTICSSALPYSWNNNEYNDAGTYVVHLINAAGCDSAATLNLSVNAIVSSTTNVTICSSALPYNWNSIDYPAAGTYEMHFTSTTGCDSTATLVLTITHATTSSETVTNCDSYDWNGTTYTESGTYTAHFTNIAGCDSTATLILTITHATSSSETVTNCDSYDWNGTTYTESGTYTAHFTNAAGCDSTATLVLTITHATTSSETVTNCDSYDWNGTTYTESGTYSAHFTNAAGCDSTATLVLTITHATSSSETVTNCDSYDWNGTTYTESGTYTAHFTNAAGCDSTATLVLTITHATTSSETVTNCDSYDWNGITYTESGTYTAHFTNIAGCDSTATLILTITHSTTSTTAITNCDSYDWNGTTYTESGTYTAHFTNIAGCDSTATLILTITHATSSSETVTNCDSYDWNGTTYTESGTYTAHFTNIAGCDSTATLVLTITHATSSSETITNCDSYDWNGTTYTESGTYTAHFTNTAGCDSTATLILTITHSTTSTTAITNCDSYDWNGTTYAESGTYTAHFTNAAGCDSTATLVLTITHATSSSETVTNCDSYTWNGTTYTESGTYTAHFTNVAGCDSTAILVLTITHATSSSETVTNCDSYDWNGTTYTESGTYSAHFTNAAGCDSTATLVLTITHATSSSETITNCDSYDWNGTTYTESGTYTAHFTNAAGCDSTATLVLTITHATSSSETVTNCDSYDWNGTTYTESGTYTAHFTNIAGCDSTATLVLTITHATSSSETVTNCDSYDWNGTTYTESGTYSAHFTNAAGCDSTATLVLTITHATSSSETVTNCDSYTWNGTTYAESGTYTAHFTNTAGCDSTATLVLTITHSTTSTTTITNCDSYDWNGTTYTESGTYTAHFTNTAGCDSTATLILTIHYSTTSTTDVTVCSNSLPYIWNGLTLPETSTYVAHLVNAAGCDSLAVINLTVNVSPLPPLITANGPTTFDAGGSVTLTSSQANNNLWNTSATTQSIVVTTSGSYTVVYTDPSNGCSSISSDPTVVTVNSTPGGGGGARVATQPAQQTADPKIELTAMPNPTTTYFTLVIKSDSPSPMSLKISNNFGTVVESHSKVAPNTTMQVGQGWFSGVYFAEVIQDGKRKVIKIIKIN